LGNPAAATLHTIKRRLIEPATLRQDCMKKIIQLRETTTVCCVCGGHISGPWPAAQNLSHGYCEMHYQAAIQEIDRYFSLLESARSLAGFFQKPANSPEAGRTVAPLRPGS